MSRDDVSVDATFTVAGAGLRVEYVVRSRRDAALWVLDDLLVHRVDGFVRAEELAIVREDDEADDTALILRGAVAPLATVAFVFYPGGRRLEPGGSLSGVAITELPLMARHPQERRPHPLRGTRTRVVLAVGVLDGDVTLRETPLAGGGAALVVADGDVPAQRWVRSAPFELPR